MKRIRIKAWFGDWHEVTEEKAYEFVQNMMKRITTRSTFDGKAELIDGTHLQGTTCKELLESKRKEKTKMKTKRALTAYEELNMDGGAHCTNIDVARKAAREGRDLIVHRKYYDGQRFHYFKYRVTDLQETPSGDVVGTVHISERESVRWEATRRLCDYAITGRI